MKKLALLFSIILVTQFTSAKVISVPADQATIQAAIDASTNGDTVLVADGTYYENINFKGKAITVASKYIMNGDWSHVSQTVIDGSKPADPKMGSTVTMATEEDSTSVISGFTIRGGTGWGDIPGVPDQTVGAGIVCEGGKIESNIITDNHMTATRHGNGGGIFCFLQKSRNFVLRNNIIKNNVIESQWAGHGGGIHFTGAVDSGFAVIEGNTFDGNQIKSALSLAGGGGISIGLKLPTAGYDIYIRNNKILNNTLEGFSWSPIAFGAGISVEYFDPGTQVTDMEPNPKIINNIIHNNVSEFVSGGIYVSSLGTYHHPDNMISPQPEIINNTIMNNIAPEGAGLFNYDAHPFLMNNIFWNDLSAPGCSEFSQSDFEDPYPEDGDKLNTGEITAMFNIIQGGYSGNGNIDKDPNFQLNSFEPSNGSPCIGAGLSSVNIGGVWYYHPQKDYYNNSRPNPNDNLVDIGAIESPFIAGVGV